MSNSVQWAYDFLLACAYLAKSGVDLSHGFVSGSAKTGYGPRSKHALRVVISIVPDESGKYPWIAVFIDEVDQMRGMSHLSGRAAECVPVMGEYFLLSDVTDGCDTPIASVSCIDYVYDPKTVGASPRIW